jgi:hypothetical protein
MSEVIGRSVTLQPIIQHDYTSAKSVKSKPTVVASTGKFSPMVQYDSSEKVAVTHRE